MIISEDRDIVLEIINIFGVRTILTKRTYDYHTGPDKNPVDADVRIKALIHVPNLLVNPRFVYIDQRYPGSRVRYLDYIADINIANSIHNLVIVVDQTTIPQEVVTWMIKRSTKQEDFSGGILYDSHSNTD